MSRAGPAHVRDEFPGDLGQLLWIVLRDVTLLAAMPPGQRAGLFTPGDARELRALVATTETGAALEATLAAIARLLDRPEEATGETMSPLCLEVACWAEDRGAHGTALGYARAAALASPDDAGAALAAGDLALRAGQVDVAEAWLWTCIATATRRRDGACHAAADVGLGNLHARRGARKQARRHFARAIRRARRHGLRTPRGQALHGLAVLATTAGDLDGAERYARGAMRAFGREHVRNPAFLHDVAYLWILGERYHHALSILRKLLPARTDPAERALTLSLLACAGAGLSDPALYERSWEDAWMLLGDVGEAGDAERVLRELVRAATLWRDWQRLRQAQDRLGDS